MYVRLARWCFAHPWWGVVTWLLILFAILGIARNLGEAYSGDLAIAGTESHDGNDLLKRHFSGAGAGPGGTIVFRAEQGVDDPAVRAAMDDLFDRVRALEETSLISPYDPLVGPLRIARDGPEAGRIAYADVSLEPGTSGTEAQDMGRTIEGLIEELDLHSIDGLDVQVGGIWFAELRPPESEAIGLAFAVFILIAVLGSVVAMGVTVGAALVTVGIGAAAIIAFSNFMTVPDFAPAIGLMIGLGVGIDYALFIITRYRDALGEGHGREQALVVALDSAGRSVIFAGATVVVSLLGMLFIGIPFVTGFGVAAAATVAVVMVGSVTLLPSLIVLLGDRMTVTRVRGMVAAVLLSVSLFGFGAGIEPLAGALPAAIIVLVIGLFGRDRNPLRRRLEPRQVRPLRETGWYRLSRTVQARPWVFAVGGTLLLLLLAAPVLALRFGFADESNYAAETTTRKAYDLLVDGFGVGANGPLLVVTEVSGSSQMAELNRLGQALAATDGVVFVSPAIPNSPLAPTAAAIEVRPATGPQAAETEELVKHLRAAVIPAATAGTGLEPAITGLVAVKADVSDFLKSRTAVFFIAVLGASFLLLMAVFRSLVVPLKAVIMNMLSIGAAYGVLVAVFQWGWLGGLVGVEPGPIEPFMPMMLFAVLFGLSMDYEVFLLSRMKEEFERTGDAVNSVADGLAATARVITAAALIMVFVFGSFVLEDQRAIKMFGLGLAAAVAVDASLVRMLIVPSTMELLGARNWWLPAWLDRILPNLDVEGSAERSTS
ncbi:MAG: MMPL family transporter [Acidimicrobiaceae bacterium]|nr:MMPL family transporter [Acidimicrobiaceae bacterium]MXZ65939.1 MMPL family transporter [Acidimicrobiaceae bacterium]MYE65973.1 MMPL family transporter [Acidimicrobiaceae bacterium]MYF32051.1 MMPL family transporter [Acidimicrobiaceae bacterium]MYG78767.1 MMPL family transporter [Acidimicrobiaceae bacterium]